MSIVKAVLFDLDGTLVDSLSEIYYGVCRTCERLNVAPPSREVVATMIGRGVVVLVQRLKRELSLSDEIATEKEILEILLEEWGETKGEKIEFFPGVLDGIRLLRAQGVRTAVVTNKLRSLTTAFIRERGIEGLFDTVVAGDDCERAKPAPDMLIRAMEILEVSPENVVMVGDSRNDALAARGAGVKVALVKTGYNEGVRIDEWAREAGFTRVYSTARQVCQAIVSGRL